MIKNIDFTKNYLDKIISATEQHPINEWLNAFEKLSTITNELKLDIRNMNTESLEINLTENKFEVANEIKRADFCTESVLNSSIKIIQASSEEEFKYDDISELIRSAWWELISFFDYSQSLYVSAYTISMFNNSAKILEKAITIAADKLQ